MDKTGSDTQCINQDGNYSFPIFPNSLSELGVAAMRFNDYLRKDKI